MASSDDQGIRDLFARAKGLSREECDAFLDEHCPDPAVRAAVEKLLDEAETVGTAPESGAVSGAVAGAQQPGDVIGPYKLIKQIGVGGFGIVYLAEQQHPVRREVALKVIKLGMDTQQVIARFEAERQALALMDHPNIAKVLDAGATEKGRPYFVMELVRGVPFTRFCDEQNMSLEGRLELFAQVCTAVQHAHQKGIIHRDIKPSNVLVTSIDGNPVPKVIDFGIAKATQQHLAEETAFTAQGQFVGTPAYMSPEQANPTVDDIDTRSDIYSLGVLLYELLTGVTPVDMQALRQSGWDEMCRVIRDEEPSKPSTRLSSLAGDAEQIASQRSIDVRRLARYVRGDLDWIIMKALEKERTRRYDTATGLGEDIHRFLNDEPVLAGPPSVSYRLKKLVRRNRASFAVAAVIAVLLVGGAAGIAVSLARSIRAERAARIEAAKSDQVATFLGDMLEGVGASVARGRDTTLLREILDRTATRLAAELGDQPDVEAALRSQLGVIYFELSDFDRAEEATRRALELYRAGSGNSTDIATSIRTLALIEKKTDRHEEAEALFREGLAIQRAATGERDTETARHATDLANFLVARDDVGDEPEQLLLNSLEIQREALGETHEHVAVGLNSLAILYQKRGEFEIAEEYYRRALDLHRRALGDDHPHVAIDQHNLARLLGEKGDIETAEEVYREALTLSRKLYPDGDELTASILDSLADFRSSHPDKRTEALELYQEALEIRRGIYSPVHDRLTSNLLEIGRLYEGLRDYDTAETYFRELLASKKKRYGDEHTDVAVALQNIAKLHRGKGEFEQAISLGEEALAMHRRVHGETHREVGVAMFQLGVTHQTMGDFDNAVARFEESVATFRAAQLSETEQAVNARERLARALRSADRHRESADVLREALEIRARVGSDQTLNALGTSWELARTLTALGEHEEAETLFVYILSKPKILGVRPQAAVRGSYIDSLIGVERFTDAEAQLQIFFENASAREPGGSAESEAIDRFARFYESWSAAEPGQGHEAQAAEWRAKL